MPKNEQKLPHDEPEFIKTKKFKNFRTPKEIKRDVAETRRRIAEANEDIKINKRITKQIARRAIANPKLLTSSIINGVKNELNNAEKKYNDGVTKLKKLKFSEDPGKKDLIDYQKNKVKGFKDELKAQRIIARNESRQINKLNRLAKGSFHGKNDDGDSITIKNINKYYATGTNIFQALKNASLSIKKGSFNVILGPSGSGKTTLLNMISGLDRATFGEVIINDINISALSESQLTQFRRNEVGFVFQSYNLLSSLNVSDNIEVGRSLQTNKLRRRKIPELLESIDMDNNSKKKTYELSGGQQQRVSIARALAKTPNILIGDEPTGALDQKTSLKVFELFQEINKKQNATVIIVTHNVNVAKLADNVIHVKDGEISRITANKNPLQARDLEEI